jgi:hypothetical protein
MSGKAQFSVDTSRIEYKIIIPETEYEILRRT